MEDFGQTSGNAFGGILRRIPYAISEFLQKPLKIFQKKNELLD